MTRRCCTAALDTPATSQQGSSRGCKVAPGAVEGPTRIGTWAVAFLKSVGERMVPASSIENKGLFQDISHSSEYPKPRVEGKVALAILKEHTFLVTCGPGGVSGIMGLRQRVILVTLAGTTAISNSLKPVHNRRIAGATAHTSIWQRQCIRIKQGAQE